jgi:hypothetical protein
VNLDAAREAVNVNAVGNFQPHRLKPVLLSAPRGSIISMICTLLGGCVEWFTRPADYVGDLEWQRSAAVLADFPFVVVSR